MAHIYDQVVVLTGIRHSGKSTAARFFSQRGAVVVSADDLAREAVAPGTEGLRRVVAEFGTGILDSSGVLDRAALAKIIYASPERRAALERIVHPIVRELSLEAFTRALTGGAPLIVYDCPLFFEGNLDRFGFRGVIVVEADPEQVVHRIMDRDRVDEPEARRRLAAQFSQEERSKRADWVIDNRGSLAELESHVDRLYRQLTER